MSERTANCGRRREADLVVDDDVDRPSGAVTAKLGQVERLGDDALAGERASPWREYRRDGEVLAAEVDPVLLGARCLRAPG